MLPYTHVSLARILTVYWYHLTQPQKHWPGVHFDRRMTEQDEQWKPDQRETWDDILRRIDLFLDWLVLRREDNVVVVSHGVWIEHLFRTKYPELLHHGHRRVHNLDAFACECVSVDGKFQGLENGIQI
jgi:broad specificity phosphatase PhoE